MNDIEKFEMALNYGFIGFLIALIVSAGMFTALFT